MDPMGFRNKDETRSEIRWDANILPRFCSQKNYKTPLQHTPGNDLANYEIESLCNKLVKL